MFRSRSNVLRSVFFAGLWLCLRIPSAILVYKCHRGDFPLVEYSIALLFADTCIAVFLIYRVVSAEMLRPWKCPACDGYGKRFFSPPIDGTNPDAVATSVKCFACTGKGILWESVKGERY